MASGQYKDVEQGKINSLEDLETPLIHEDKIVSYKTDDDGTDHETRSIGMVLLSTFVAVCGSFGFGSCVGYSAPTQSAIMEDLNLTTSQYSMFGSILTIGAMLGAITSGRISDYIGRKGAMRMSAGFCITGWLAVFFSTGYLSLDMGRFFTGYGIGVISFVVPIFIAEIAPKNLRGGLTTLNQVHIQTLQSLPKARILDLFQRQYIRFVFIGVAIMVFQQFVGINGIGFYASQTFESAGLSSGTIGTIAYACIQVPITIVGALLIDKSGRKPLIMVSAAGTFLGCFLAGVSFFLKAHSLLLGWVPIMAVSGVLVYISAFSIGMGAVPWLIMSEIFPINIKGIGGSLVVLVNWSGAWLVSYTFNFLMNWSSSGTFFLYAGVSLATIVFVAKFVPETKGKTLEQIHESINS
ncbi:sugar transporter ERD6-like 16 isoform X3 [Manihot esculenta]|uniref:Uncharacterized protein n=1 Tax=Manihot esculenta TaxID=3983 RepID=A0ACB7G9P3_MANES|nr:sugar transporter ERD6-like 16 isoform X3 [Manihot esculenta]KAG8636651.1 hypothetical protein MANES_15G019200v8 [Manihot esculenta]